MIFHIPSLECTFKDVVIQKMGCSGSKALDESSVEKRLTDTKMKDVAEPAKCKARPVELSDYDYSYTYTDSDDQSLL